jgi:hypothetical protein
MNEYEDRLSEIAQQLAALTAVARRLSEELLPEAAWPINDSVQLGHLLETPAEPEML